MVLRSVAEFPKTMRNNSWDNLKEFFSEFVIADPAKMSKFFGSVHVLLKVRIPVILLVSRRKGQE
mgnify:CR=1 FL=1